MFISYTIEDFFFSKLVESANIELILERMNSLLDKFEKNTRILDCPNEYRRKSLNIDWKSFHDNLLPTDVSLKKQTEVLWLDRILKKIIVTSPPPACMCKSINDCSLENNVKQIQKTCKSFPHFIISQNSDDKLQPNLPIENYRDNSVFKKYYEHTTYEEELLLDEISGIRMIKKNWADLIVNCKNFITIYDRNVFDKWDYNYIGGLRQFAKVIIELNPDINFYVITKLAPHKSAKSNAPKSLIDIKTEIKKELQTNKPCKIEFILCESDAKFDHDRFIVFDNKISAQLNRGLDSFYAFTSTGDPKIERYRIIYYKTYEVNSYMQDPLRSRTQNEDFTNIKNY